MVFNHMKQLNLIHYLNLAKSEIHHVLESLIFQAPKSRVPLTGFIVAPDLNRGTIPISLCQKLLIERDFYIYRRHGKLLETVGLIKESNLRNALTLDTFKDDSELTLGAEDGGDR